MNDERAVLFIRTQQMQNDVLKREDKDHGETV
jgi:hypothetical protein